MHRNTDAVASQRLIMVVALDRNSQTEPALEQIATLARACNAQVVLLNVFSAWSDIGHIIAPTRDQRLAYACAERELFLRDLAGLLDGLDVRTRVAIRAWGEEVDECIARVAQMLCADLLVVVSSRVSGAAGVLLGSTARGVLHRSTCPVLVVQSRVR
jgi:nucleotide-binding universal stress UspA family protein